MYKLKGKYENPNGKISNISDDVLKKKIWMAIKNMKKTSYQINVNESDELWFSLLY
jgi:hypothetical protein